MLTQVLPYPLDSGAKVRAYYVLRQLCLRHEVTLVSFCRPSDSEAALAHLRGLDLTDAQRDQIREIVQRYQQQMRSDILLVLTPDQQQKLKAAEAERDARMKQRLERRQQQRQQQNP